MQSKTNLFPRKEKIVNTSHIPGPYDAEMLLEAAAGVTKTETYDGAAKDLGAGYAPGGIGQPVAAVIQVSALDKANTTETYAAQLEESDDDLSYTAAGPSIAIAATGAVSIPGFLSKRYARLKITIGGDTPSITYKAHLVPLGHVG